MNTKASLSVLAALLALTVTAPVQAATVVCSGTIDWLQFDATSTGGLFSIKLSSMNVAVYFCDPDNSFTGAGSGYSISAATCRSLYATFLAAKVSGTPVTNMYFDGSSVPATCDGWAAWQSANIRHYYF
jgi:hypothetical protein